MVQEQGRDDAVLYTVWMEKGLEKRSIRSNDENKGRAWPLPLFLLLPTHYIQSMRYKTDSVDKSAIYIYILIEIKDKRKSPNVQRYI